MAEFSTVREELSHDGLVEGGTSKSVVGNGVVKVSRFGSFVYYHFNTSVAFDCRIGLQPATEMRLVFVIKGKGVRVGCVDEVRTLSAGEGNCMLVKGGCKQYVAVESAGDCEFIILVVSRSGLLMGVADNLPWFRKFLHADRCTWLLRGPNMVLGMRKIGVVQQLLYDWKPTYLQHTYAQLKLTELLVLFLEKADSLVRKGAIAGLRPEDTERMQRVRDMLHNRPAQSYSLVGLAHAVGTNEATLKKNFKAMFGTTVFGYLTARRMELAKELLLEKELKVSVVAQEVGYKYASHFTAAFRKHFGMLPTKVMRVVIPIVATLVEFELESMFLLVA